MKKSMKLLIGPSRGTWRYTPAVGLGLVGLALVLSSTSERLSMKSTLPVQPKEARGVELDTSGPAWELSRTETYDDYLLARARREIASQAGITVHNIQQSIAALGAAQRQAMLAELHGLRQSATAPFNTQDRYVEKVSTILLKHLNKNGVLEQTIKVELDQYFYVVEQYEEWVRMESGLDVSNQDTPTSTPPTDVTGTVLRDTVHTSFADYAGNIKRMNRNTAGIESFFVGTTVLAMVYYPAYASVEAAVSLVAWGIISYARDVEGRSGVELENGVEKLADAVCFGVDDYPGLYASLLAFAEERLQALNNEMATAEQRAARDFHVVPGTNKK